jgi:hypothetical protein
MAISRRTCARSSTGIKAQLQKFKIMCRDGKGFWHGVRWDGKTASSFSLEETDERIAHEKLLEQK